MKVLYLTFDDLSVPFAWSVHVKAIVNGLVDRGHQVRVVAPGSDPQGLRASFDPLPSGKLHHVAGSVATFVRSGRALEADVVYVRGIHLSVTPAMAARTINRPLVVEINGLLEHEVPGGWRRKAVRAAHRYTLKRTERVVTVSPLLRTALSRDYDFPEDRIDVVPNGADTTLFQPGDSAEARRKLDLPAEGPIVLCVASFYPHHARELLVEAARRAGALLVLVGGGEPGREENVIHVGRVDHDRVVDYIAAADICAYALQAPHADFGFSPVKVYEYMAGGRPVVAATDMEDLREFVNGNGIGEAVTLDADGLAGALARLLGDREGRERMGRRGRELAETEYTWDRAVGQVEETLRRAVGG